MSGVTKLLSTNNKMLFIIDFVLGEMADAVIHSLVKIQNMSP